MNLRGWEFGLFDRTKSRGPRLALRGVDGFHPLPLQQVPQTRDAPRDAGAAGDERKSRRPVKSKVAVGQKPVPPVNIPIPIKIGSKMGGAPTKGMPLVLTRSQAGLSKLAPSSESLICQSGLLFVKGCICSLLREAQCLRSQRNPGKSTRYSKNEALASSAVVPKLSFTIGANQPPGQINIFPVVIDSL